MKSSVAPETMTMQDIYLKMANLVNIAIYLYSVEKVSARERNFRDLLIKLFSQYQANLEWDQEADQEARKDSDKSLALYLSAPKIRNKLEKVKEDTRLFRFWHQHVENMPIQK